MVIGIETAGLVLASIPLAVSLAEKYREGLKPFRILRHFRREFFRHVVQVKTQHVIFRVRLEKLLQQVVSVDEAEKLMKDPGGPAWADAQLEMWFQQLLGDTYASIVDNIAEINRVMDELNKELKLSSTPSQAELPSLSVRLKFSFSRAKWTELEQLLERHNDNIDRLLSSSEERSYFPAASCNSNLHQLAHFELLFSYCDAGDKSTPERWKPLDVEVDVLNDNSASSQPAQLPPTAGSQHYMRSSSPPPETTHQSILPQNHSHSVMIQDIYAATMSGFLHVPRQVFLCNNKGHAALRLHSLGAKRISTHLPTLVRLDELFPTVPSNPFAVAPMPFSRFERLKLALALAKYFLYLHLSPWLPDVWGKCNILFRPSKSSDSHLLYITSDAARTTNDPPSFAGVTHFPNCIASSAKSVPTVDGTTTTPPPPLLASEKRRRSLRHLGILLLELCFGHALEEHPRYKELQLHILLTEELAELAARYWQASVYGEAGPDFGHAVLACISGDLEARYPRETDFLRAVHCEVVKPLERVMQQFKDCQRDYHRKSPHDGYCGLADDRPFSILLYPNKQVALRALHCFNEFHNLAGRLASAPKTLKQGVPGHLLHDEQGRFSIWAHSMGLLGSSAAYGPHTAAHSAAAEEQLLAVLNELGEALDDGKKESS